jgi:Sec-independent protein secretion pathway component TatC
MNISMSGQFSAHITSSLYAGFIISFPYVFWEFWKFIVPALKDEIYCGIIHIHDIIEEGIVK